MTNPLPSVPPFEALVFERDTREQRGWTSEELGGIHVVDVTLDVADYSVRGCPDLRIERKSLDDLAQCVGRDRERFEREIRKLRCFQFPLIVVEGSWHDVEAGNYRSNVSPKAVLGSLLGWQAEGVGVLMAGDRASAAKYAARFCYIVARRQWRASRNLLGAYLSQLEANA